MEQSHPVVRHLPHRELEIRRCWIRDEEFRAICTDYEEADRALRHWQALVCDGDEKQRRTVDEYRCFLAELEEEIVAHLDRARSRREGDDPAAVSYTR